MSFSQQCLQKLSKDHFLNTEKNKGKKKEGSLGLFQIGFLVFKCNFFPSLQAHSVSNRTVGILSEY